MAARGGQPRVATRVDGDFPRIVLPTQTIPSYEQHLIGQDSLVPGIEEFRGIPYATIPARWQHALLRERLPEDIFYATQNGCRCPQPKEPNNSEFYQSHLEFPSDVTESEFDCLNLFITRPSASTLIAAGFDPESVKIPVYVYIHGGAYSFGAGTDPMWDPARLVGRSVGLGTPIIVATVNYRLNMFGFAASSEIIQVQPDGQLKGCNFGLGDQRTALYWIQKNIGAFGGDATQVTVGGQSAGGSSSHAHVLEAILGQGEPLVQRGIIQSGAVGVLGPISMEAADQRWAVFCEEIGAPSGDYVSRMEFMATVPIEKILRTSQELGWQVCPLVVDELTISQRPNGRWSIHLAGKKERVRSVRDTANSAVISVLIGDTDLEGSIHFSQVSKIESFEQLNGRLAIKVKSPEFLDRFYRAYALEPDMSVAQLQEGILHFLSDMQFGKPVQLAREELMGWDLSKINVTTDDTNARPTAVQSYRVKFGNPFPGINYAKAHHCVDLIYIYDCFEEALRDVDEALPAQAVTHASLVERIQADWIQFITAPSDGDQCGLATVYDVDRTAVSVSMAMDRDFMARKARLDLLSSDGLAAQQTIKELIGSGHVL
ncbi:carboxylesterase [Penicillium macrosclerotiorum]|uniref:carboxylesterase n=1 Tax=Penicillium macrosclerotiorum TaxID=303699 RepID=UPI002546DA1C|nr:carboxylesterase [Penicillium macrosclerotiorum]KAJ5689206.1 carboxylesterase [Penicillium macrosclerotiorum]